MDRAPCNGTRRPIPFRWERTCIGITYASTLLPRFNQNIVERWEGVQKLRDHREIMPHGPFRMPLSKQVAGLVFALFQRIYVSRIRSSYMELSVPSSSGTLLQLRFGKKVVKGYAISVPSSSGTLLQPQNRRRGLREFSISVPSSSGTLLQQRR